MDVPALLGMVDYGDVALTPGRIEDVLSELLRSALVAQEGTYDPTPLTAAAALVFVLLWPVARLTAGMERRMVAPRRRDRRHDRGEVIRWFTRDNALPSMSRRNAVAHAVLDAVNLDGNRVIGGLP